MTVYFAQSGPLGLQSQRVAAIQAILRAQDPQFVQVALANAGFANCTVMGDGSVFNNATGLFLTAAQLDALWPANVPHNWGATV